MLVAAKEEMFSPSSDPGVLLPLAAFEGVGENSRQGITTKNPILHRGSSELNSTTALGMQPVLRWEGIRSRYTGKERDSESNLDNFGARYNSPTLGRFMSPDPSNLSVDYWLPQTWNRYSYSLGNPLAFVDRNGLWPTYIHNQIINEAFPGLSAQDLRTLRDASYNMDHDPGAQDEANSPEHGMASGATVNALGGTYFEQTPEEAQQLGDAFIGEQEKEAQDAQADWIASGHTGICPVALTHFGNALHTIVDRTSPSHIGNQRWYGSKWWQPRAWTHYLGEASPTSFEREGAIREAQRAFRQTFGVDEFDLMRLTNMQGRSCVTVTDSASGTTTTSCSN